VFAFEPRRLRTAAIALAAAALTTFAGAFAGCGADEEKHSGVEGEFIHAGEAVYQVQLTRLLNPRQQPDTTLLRGQSAPPSDQSYIAVFMKVENKGDEPYAPPRDMKLVDTVGNQYLPLDSTQSGFGLDFGARLAKGDEAPAPDSPAAQGPDAGAMVLFRVKTESATDNLPMKLSIPAGGEETSDIELDI
jgi:hypothetical protein